MQPLVAVGATPAATVAAAATEVADHLGFGTDGIVNSHAIERSNPSYEEDDRHRPMSLT